jgi:hypothetical protein
MTSVTNLLLVRDIYKKRLMKILLSEEQYKNLPNSQPYISDKNFELLKKFISNCKKELEVDHPLTVKLKGARGGDLETFAYYKPEDKSIGVYVKDRHLGDIMRSIAHELKHLQQDLNKQLGAKSGEDGSTHENEANSFAGVMMRKFGREFPQIYEGVQKKKVLKENNYNSQHLYKSEKYGSFEGVIHFDIDKVKNWFIARKLDYNNYINNIELPVAFLNNININSRYRGKGLGNDLYSDFEQECYDFDVRCIILECDNSEVQKKGFSLENWYLSLDYEIIGTEHGNSILKKTL